MVSGSIKAILLYSNLVIADESFLTEVGWAFDMAWVLEVTSTLVNIEISCNRNKLHPVITGSAGKNTLGSLCSYKAILERRIWTLYVSSNQRII